MRTCNVPGCEKSIDKGGKGYCSMHYTRLVRKGSVGQAEPLVETFASLAERFWAKVDTTSGECWEWTASLNPSGYGQFNADGSRPIHAHRVAWFIEHGSYPGEGMELDHLCRNRACVRPAHLEPVPPRINFLRGEHPTAVAYRNGTCHAGHPRTEENVYVRPSGKRECRTCMRASQERQQAKRKAATS